MLPREHEHAGVVPTRERGLDLLLLPFASTHVTSVSHAGPSVSPPPDRGQTPR